MALERLDKVLSNLEIASRRQVKDLVKRGSIEIDGIVVKNSDIKLDPEHNIISINKKPVIYQKYSYIMLNKPAGVISASSDKNARTVVDLLPPELIRKDLFPAGRLDKDSEGFVLLTNDGEFAHRILSPKKHVPKTYEVILDKPAGQELIEKFAQGVKFTDGTVCRPAQLSLLDSPQNKHAQVVIFEGMYHQIKRMFKSFGITVIYLKRTKIGNLDLDTSLQIGQSKAILHKDLIKILEPVFDQNA